MYDGELQELEKDLITYHEIHGFEWSEPSKILDYLSSQRIHFYHSVLDKCSANNIDFNKKIVADFGTGPGYLLRLISRRYKAKKLFGYDVSDKTVGLGPHLVPEAIFKRHKMPEITKQKYDIIILSQVLEHVFYPEEILLSSVQMLNKKGILLITIPDGRTDNIIAGEKYEHLNSYWGHINFWSIESFGFFMKKMFNENQYFIDDMFVKNFAQKKPEELVKKTKKILSIGGYELSVSRFTKPKETTLSKKEDGSYHIFCMICPDGMEPHM